MEKDLRFVFFGTPDVASKTLDILKAQGYVPSLIITAPDRPVGRHFVMTPSPVKTWADEHTIPVLQPEKITPEFVEKLRTTPSSSKPSDATPPTLGGDSEQWDLFIVVAYGKILPQNLIDIPKLGTLNIHYSLLPRWRGASPVEAAILAGNTETGVSIQKMIFKLDAGPIIAEEKLVIEPNDTTPTLREKLIILGGNLLAKILPDIVSGTISPQEQNEDYQIHCGKTKKEDGLVDPLSDDAELLWRKYRAYQPWPGLYFMQDGKRIKITQARFENNKFIIEKVIPEGKKEMSW